MSASPFRIELKLTVDRWNIVQASSVLLPPFKQHSLFSKVEFQMETHGTRASVSIRPLSFNLQFCIAKWPFEKSSSNGIPQRTLRHFAKHFLEPKLPKGWKAGTGPNNNIHPICCEQLLQANRCIESPYPTWQKHIDSRKLVCADGRQNSEQIPAQSPNEHLH